MLGELFVATVEELENLDFISNSPTYTLKGIDSSDIDTVKLATLQSIMTREDYAEILKDQTPYYTDLEEGPWIINIPEKLITSLVLYKDLNELAALWLKTEELQLENWSKNEIISFLTKFQELASDCLKADKRCYYWMSL